MTRSWYDLLVNGGNATVVQDTPLLTNQTKVTAAAAVVGTTTTTELVIKLVNCVKDTFVTHDACRTLNTFEWYLCVTILTLWALVLIHRNVKRLYNQMQGTRCPMLTCLQRQQQVVPSLQPHPTTNVTYNVLVSQEHLARLFANAMGSGSSINSSASRAASSSSSVIELDAPLATSSFATGGRSKRITDSYRFRHMGH